MEMYNSYGLKIRRDSLFLITFCKENNIELLKNYSNEKINGTTKIEGKCVTENCENTFLKVHRDLIKTGGYCKLCMHKIKQEHFIQTCLEKYGTTNPNKNREVREKIEKTNLEKYGAKFSLQNKEIKEKMNKTCLKNHGVKYPSQNKKIREKSKQTCLKNHGVEYPQQNPLLREKSKQTNLKILGVENPSQNKDIQNKIKQTFIKNYGVEHVLQNKDIKEKIKKVCLEKYGVEYATQNSEISEKASKNSYSSKNYTFPTGKTIKVQGYEPYGLDELIKIEKTNEDDIITSRLDVPTIWYEDKEGKKHRYFVDIFIPSQNRCIEIKSTWTMKKKHDNVLEKHQATKDAGYECEIWVYNGKGEKVECIK